MTDYPAAVTYSALVSLLDRAGFRPKPARPEPGHSAWGAPTQHYAACPVCLTDGSLIVHPWSDEDPRAVLYCNNPDECAAFHGEASAESVHLALLAALQDAVSQGEGLSWPSPAPNPSPTGARRGEYTGGLSGASGPAFPPEVVDNLPPRLRDMVRGVARTYAVPESAALGVGLAALAGASGGIGRVQPFRANPSWTEPVALSVAVIMPSGSGKTGLGADFTRGHALHHDRAREQAAGAMLAAEARARAGRLRVKQCEAEAAKDRNTEAVLADEIAALEQAERDARGPRPVLIGTNVTAEGLVALLAEQGRAFLVADESGGLDGILGLYSGKSMTGDLNNALDERRVEVVRKVKDRSAAVRRPSLVMALLLQPSVLDDLRADRRANAGGFTPRLAYIVPPDPGPSLPGATRPVLDPEAREAWDALVGDLCTARDEVYRSDEDADTAPRLHFTTEAEAVFAEWEGRVRSREVEAPTEALRSWRRKNPGRAASIAALLHLARHGSAGMGNPVGHDDAALASLIADSLDEHAVVSIGSRDRLDSDADPVRLMAGRIVAWAKDRPQPGAPFTSSDLRRVKRVTGTANRGAGASERIRDALHLLADEGMAEVTEREERGRVVVTATLTPEALSD